MVIAQIQSVQGACRSNKDEGYHGQYFLYEFCMLRNRLGDTQIVNFAPRIDQYGDLSERNAYKVKQNEIKIMGVS